MNVTERIAEIIPTVRYVTDDKGKKTDVLVPFPAWQAFTMAWDLLIEKLEDQEDRHIALEWLTKRGQNSMKTISLDELEQELSTDGLLPSAGQ
jgi:hypothetical protein